MSNLIDNLDIDDQNLDSNRIAPPSSHPNFTQLDDEYDSKKEEFENQQASLDKEILEIEKKKLELQLEILKQKLENAELKRLSDNGDPKLPSAVQKKEMLNVEDDDFGQHFNNLRKKSGNVNISNSQNTIKETEEENYISEKDNFKEESIDNYQARNPNNDSGRNQLTEPLQLDFKSLGKNEEQTEIPVIPPPPQPEEFDENEERDIPIIVPPIIPAVEESQ